ncbi:TPA: hypothetical protein ACQUJI_001479 [Neisseria cinerea]|nr:hypothetical protein [Neisseria cinerea]
MPSEPRYGKLRQQKTDGKYAVRFYFHPDLWAGFPTMEAYHKAKTKLS